MLTLNIFLKIFFASPFSKHRTDFFGYYWPKITSLNLLYTSFHLFHSIKLLLYIDIYFYLLFFFFCDLVVILMYVIVIVLVQLKVVSSPYH